MATVSRGGHVGPTRAQIMAGMMQQNAANMENFGKSMEFLAQYKEAKRQFNGNRFLDILGDVGPKTPGGILAFIKENPDFMQRGLGYLFSGPGQSKYVPLIYKELSTGNLQPDDLRQYTQSAVLSGDILPSLKNMIQENRELAGLMQQVGTTPGEGQEVTTERTYGQTGVQEEAGGFAQGTRGEGEVSLTPFTEEQLATRFGSFPQYDVAGGIQGVKEPVTRAAVPGSGTWPPGAQVRMPGQGYTFKDLQEMDPEQRAKVMESWPLDEVVRYQQMDLSRTRSVSAGTENVRGPGRIDLEDTISTKLGVATAPAGGSAKAKAVGGKEGYRQLAANLLGKDVASVSDDEALAAWMIDSIEGNEGLKKRYLGASSKDIEDRTEADRAIINREGKKVVWALRDGLLAEQGNNEASAKLFKQAEYAINFMQQTGALEGDVKDNPLLAELYASPTALEERKVTVSEANAATARMQVEHQILQDKDPNSLPWLKFEHDKKVADLLYGENGIEWRKLDLQGQQILASLMAAQARAQALGELPDDVKLGYQSLEKQYLELYNQALKDSGGNTRKFNRAWQALMQDPAKKKIIENYEVMQDAMLRGRFTGWQGGGGGGLAAGSPEVQSTVDRLTGDK